MNIKVIKILRLCLLLALGAQAEPANKTIAILDFYNHGPEEYNDFLKGVPDMMMTNLGNIKGLRVIERVQIEKAMKAFNMENSGITKDNSVKMGQWLGADILVFGSMIKQGNTIRFDARFIEASSGEQLAGSSVYGKENEVMYLIDQLCEKIATRFTGDVAVPKDTVVPQAVVSEQLVPATIRIGFSMYMSLLAEERFYHEKCKIYIDNKLVKETDRISDIDYEYELFNDMVKPGSHAVEIMHYYINDKGECVKKAYDQPKVFLIHTTPGNSTFINYKLKLGVEGHNEFVYGDNVKFRVF
jgi:TolB-like protein